jgi:hypothetical protein
MMSSTRRSPREAFDTEETAAYTTDLDDAVKEHDILGE